MRYWIDDMGALWKGPVAPDSTMHYATFEGRDCGDGQCWIIRRSGEPENADEITQSLAETIISQYWEVNK